MIDKLISDVYQKLGPARAPAPRNYPIWPGRFSGRVAFVTGAAGGVGMSSVRRLAREGASVVAVDRDAARLAAVVDDLKAQGMLARGEVVDLTQQEQVNNTIERTERDFGRIDLVLNSAGVAQNEPWADMTRSEWDQMIDINLTSMFFLIQKVVVGMTKRKYGRIVNISSGAGKEPRDTSMHYAASKAGVISITRSYAAVLAKQGVTVNAICPGVVLTPMTLYLEEQWEARWGKRPAREGGWGIGRPTTPEEIAGLIMFLLSEEAEYMTGQALNFDGGGNMLS